MPDAIPRTTIGFCWFWLVFASLLSVLGNIIHALLKGPTGYGVLPAIMAAVPPVILLGSTHFLGLLIKSRRHRVTRATLAVYLAFLTLTVAIAGGAFWLSFDALRDLAVILGTDPNNAGVFPLIIDFSITASTLALLYLTSESVPAAHLTQAPHLAESGSPQTELVPERHLPAVGEQLPDDPEPTEHDDVALIATTGTVDRHELPIGAINSSGYDFSDYAAKLVREGRTQQPPEVVARVLDLHQSGMSIFAIANSFEPKLHRTTVSRIIDASREDLDAKALAG